MTLEQWLASYLMGELQAYVDSSGGIAIPYLNVKIPNPFVSAHTQEKSETAQGIVKQLESMQDPIPETDKDFLFFQIFMQVTSIQETQKSADAKCEKFEALTACISLFKEVNKFNQYSKVFNVTQKASENEFADFEVLLITPENSRNDLITFLIKHYFIVGVKILKLESKEQSHNIKREIYVLSLLRQILFQGINIDLNTVQTNASIEIIRNNVLSAIESLEARSQSDFSELKDQLKTEVLMPTVSKSANTNKSAGEKLEKAAVEAHSEKKDSDEEQAGRAKTDKKKLEALQAATVDCVAGSPLVFSADGSTFGALSTLSDSNLSVLSVSMMEALESKPAAQKAAAKTCDNR